MHYSGIGTKTDFLFFSFSTVDEYSPQKKNKALFHQFSLKENWLQHRGTVTETEEIFCHVYITEHSYVSVKAKVSSTAQEILKVVAEKIQHAEEDLALVAVTFSGGKLFSVLEY
uniref:Rap guanine nucleotide exchange factor 5 n=1 Tax=Rousettus aegyptiacus TaxID=9407 RepID=A0A7J8D8L3_ROUAE|nr:Rap guanine nucleotide exchange factor 5 [Rousettus aegyptiacus]